VFRASYNNGRLFLHAPISTQGNNLHFGKYVIAKRYFWFTWEIYFLFIHELAKLMTWPWGIWSLVSALDIENDIRLVCVEYNSLGNIFKILIEAIHHLDIYSPLASYLDIRYCDGMQSSNSDRFVHLLPLSVPPSSLRASWIPHIDTFHMYAFHSRTSKVNSRYRTDIGLRALINGRIYLCRPAVTVLRTFLVSRQVL